MKLRSCSVIASSEMLTVNFVALKRRQLGGMHEYQFDNLDSTSILKLYLQKSAFYNVMAGVSGR